MTDKEKKEKILKKAHELANKAELVKDKLPKSTLIAVAIDMAEWTYANLVEEPVSVWRDAKHQPKMFRKYLVRYSDGSVSGSWERHDDDFIPWKDVVKEHGFTHWCYVEDLLKL